jgi:hypothetical protein
MAWRTLYLHHVLRHDLPIVLTVAILSACRDTLVEKRAVILRCDDRDGILPQSEAFLSARRL